MSQNPAPAFDPNASYQPAAPAGAQAAPAFDPNAAYQPIDAAPAQSQAAQPSHPGVFDLLAGNPQASPEVGEGFIKGAKETARTVVGAADSAANWINRKLGTSELHVPIPFEGQDLEGKTPLESVGKGAESLTEFLLGDEALKSLSLVEQAKHLGDAGRLLQKSPKLAKAVEIGANALRQGTVGGAQTLAHGGTASDALTTGIATAGTGTVLETATPYVAQKLGSVLEKYAPDFMNSLLKTRKGNFLYGKNPGQAIIDEHLTVPKSLTRAGQFENLHGQLESAGNSLDSQVKQILNDPKVAANKQDVLPLIQQTIADAKQHVTQQTGLDTRAYLSALSDLESNIVNKYDVNGNLVGKIQSAQSPADISDIKKSLGKNTQWKLDPKDPQFTLKSYVNSVRKSLYGQLVDLVENATPDPKALQVLNHRYANVIEAQGLLENRIADEHGSGGWNAAARKAEWGSALVGLLSGHPPAQMAGGMFLANRFARSVPGRVIESQAGAATGKALQSPVIKATAGAIRPSAIVSSAMSTSDEKPAQTATGPNGHQIYLSPNGNTWIDSVTGQPMGSDNAQQ